MVAEGVETQSQLQRLIELGCEYGQGFLLARPLPPDVAESVIRTAQSDAVDVEPTLRMRGAPHRSSDNVV